MTRAAATSTAAERTVHFKLPRVLSAMAKKRMEPVNRATRNHMGVAMSIFRASALATAVQMGPMPVCCQTGVLARFTYTGYSRVQACRAEEHVGQQQPHHALAQVFEVAPAGLIGVPGQEEKGRHGKRHHMAQNVDIGKPCVGQHHGQDQDPLCHVYVVQTGLFPGLLLLQGDVLKGCGCLHRIIPLKKLSSHSVRM